MPARVRMLSGEKCVLSDAQLDELRTGFHGSLLTPGDQAYAESRIVQNALIDRRPGMIVRCSGAADVIDALDLARKHPLLTAVRAGGHNVVRSADGPKMPQLGALQRRYDRDNLFRLNNNIAPAES